MINNNETVLNQIAEWLEDALGYNHNFYYKPVNEQIVVQPVVQSVNKKIGRNDPCFCGSGKKYKKCCRGKEGT